MTAESLGSVLKQSLEATLTWEHPTPERLKLNACLFFAAFLCSLGVGLSSSLKGRARIAYTACCIHLIAATSYFLMSNNLVPMILSPKGRPVLVTRLFEWMVTVPMLLNLIAWLVDPDSKRLTRLLGRQFFCLATGGVGPLLTFPFNWLLFSYSCYLQVVVLITLHQYFTGMKRKLHSAYDRALLSTLHVFILLVFTIYAVFWLFAVELNLFSLETETFVYANLDISTKLLLTSVLSNLTGAAYDYDFVEFPRYFKEFMASIGVPVFGVARDGTIVCWNVAMEAATGRAAGTVLYAKADRCGAFTKEGAAAVREAVAKATGNASQVAQQQRGPGVPVQIEIAGHSNPQDARTPFYVLARGEQGAGANGAAIDSSALPQVFFIEASANAAAAHQAFTELTRRLSAAATSGDGSNTSSGGSNKRATSTSGGGDKKTSGGGGASHSSSNASTASNTSASSRDDSRTGGGGSVGGSGGNRGGGSGSLGSRLS